MKTILSINEEAIFTEDFSEAFGSTAPPGWTIEVLEGNPETDSWRFDNPGERSQLENFASFEGNFAVYDSDALSDDGIAESIVLKSPVFDVSDSEEVYLLFDQYYGGIATGDFASQVYVEASANGENWEEVYFSNTGTILTNSPTLDLTEELAGEENAQIRFRFDGNWSFLWAIDNVEVYDFLTPGITTPLTDVGVSEDNVPDPLNFQFALESRPTAPVTLSFEVDGEQLEYIESLTFTPDNWFEPQTSVVRAIDDGIDEGNDQISLVSVTVESEDSNYDGLKVEDVEVQITDNAIPGFTSYRTVEKTYEDLSALAEANPDIASWIDIGDSYDKVTSGGSEGYDIYAIELTNKNSGIEDKPTLYVQGAIHAREYTTTETVTRFAEELVAGYGTDADTTWLLDYYNISIVPIVNPDGRKFAEQGYSWRRNTNPNPPEGEEPAAFPNYGVDLNRNFGRKWGEIPGGSSGDPSSNTYRGDSPFSEPESQAVRDYVTSLFPDQKGPGDFEPAPSDTTGIFLDVHSFGNLLLYPYGWTDLPAGNKKELETLGRKFGYFTGLDGEAYDVSQSIGLYPTDGTTTTWAYGELGIASYTFELGTTFFQDTEYFEEIIVPEIMPSLMYAAKAAYRPYQTPAGPETIEVSTDLAQVVAGTEVVITATADDTRYDDGEVSPTDSGDEPVQNIAQARYSINSPSWIEGTEFFSLESVDGELDSSVEELTATIDTSELEAGRHTVFIESQDANGNFGVPTAVFIDIIDFFAGADVIDGSDESELLVGTSDEEVVYGRGGDDTVAGESGADLIFGNDGADVLLGDSNQFLPVVNPKGGDDLIYGGSGADYIDGNAGNDSLYGEGDDDYILGNVGDDLIDGGAGDDTLVGDDFYRDGGEDIFVLATEGTDVIVDFGVDNDLIELPATISFGELTISQDRQDTLIDYESETLAVLRDVSADTITESSFVPV
ncbi:MAG: M14 family zinc carboxypeptidase [Xenococcaceae cyanobacterium]